MDTLSQGRCIANALSAGTLLLGLAACFAPSDPHRDNVVREVTAADVQREQDHAPAISDAALPRGAAPMMAWDGYAGLQAGPDHTPGELLKQNRRDAPSCVTVVSFAMERSDA